MTPELCDFPNCKCAFTEMRECMVKLMLPRAGEVIAKPRYRIVWAHNGFSLLPSMPLGYWITPYLSNGELDKLDMRNYHTL